MKHEFISNSFLGDQYNDDQFGNRYRLSQFRAKIKGIWEFYHQLVQQRETEASRNIQNTQALLQQIELLRKTINQNNLNQSLETIKKVDYETQINDLNERLNRREYQIGKIRSNCQLKQSEMKDLEDNLQRKENVIINLNEMIQELRQDRQFSQVNSRLSNSSQDEEQMQQSVLLVSQSNIQIGRVQSSKDQQIQNLLLDLQKSTVFKLQWDETQSISKEIKVQGSKVQMIKQNVQNRMDHQIFHCLFGGRKGFLKQRRHQHGQNRMDHRSHHFARISSLDPFTKQETHKIIFRILQQKKDPIIFGIMTSQDKNNTFKERQNEQILFQSQSSTQGLLVRRHKKSKHQGFHSLGTKPGGCIQMIVDLKHWIIKFTRLPFMQKEVRQKWTIASIPESFRDKDIYVFARLKHFGDQFQIVNL